MFLAQVSKIVGTKVTALDNHYFVAENKVYDTIFSLFAAYNKADRYHDFVTNNFFSSSHLKPEFDRYAKYEQRVLEIEQIFNSIPNLKKSYIDDSVYYFEKDTEVEIEGKKYQVEKYAKVFLLRNFAGHNLGMIMQWGHNQTPIYKNIPEDLFFRPFFDFKALRHRKVKIVINDKYARDFKYQKFTVFLPQNFKYLLYFFKRYKHIDFELSFSKFPIKPTILLKHPELKALLYKNFKLAKTNIVDWIMNAKLSQQEALDLYNFLASMKVVDEVHPSFIKKFSQLRSYLYRKGKKGLTRSGFVLDREIKKISFVMESVFTYTKENGRFTLIANETGDKFYYDMKDNKKQIDKIADYLTRNHILDEFREMGVNIYYRLTTSLRAYLNSIFDEYNDKFYMYLPDKKEWHIIGNNRTLIYSQKERRFTQSNTKKDPDSYIFVRKIVVDRKISTLAPTSRFRNVFRHMYGITVPMPYIERGLFLLKWVFTNFPVYYFANREMPIRMRILDDRLVQYIIDLLKDNLFFKIEDDEEVRRILKFAKGGTSDINSSMDFDRFVKENKYYNDKRLKRDIWSFQKQTFVRFLRKTHSEDEILETFKKKEEYLKEMSKLNKTFFLKINERHY